MNSSYQEFINSKQQLEFDHGFEPVWMPEFLFGFQCHLVEWALRRGRSGLFADCGLGKSPMQLAWAENVTRKTNKPVLILTPLAVSHQTEREAVKFDIDARVSRDGTVYPGITIANYERLHYFNPADFAGVVCDESGVLKHYNAKTRLDVTEFVKGHKYRLLCSATPAPNDVMELGTSSEALGYLSRVEMLAQYFKHDGSDTAKWRVKRHGETEFWRWICSWARACRKPSDLGFSDEKFVLPELSLRQHIVKSNGPADGLLFDMPAITLNEQRAERRKTMESRCEMVASLVNGSPTIAWCHLNAEGDMLTRMISNAVQVSGSDSDEKKEEVFRAFADGQIKDIVTKPTIAGFGLNWQHCAHQTFFPSHSYEQFYQAIRRSYRFGQKNAVKIDIVTSEGESNVMKNMERKSNQSDMMYDEIVRHMNDERVEEVVRHHNTNQEQPAWL